VFCDISKFVGARLGFSKGIVARPTNIAQYVRGLDGMAGGVILCAGCDGTRVGGVVGIDPDRRHTGLVTKRIVSE